MDIDLLTKIAEFVTADDKEIRNLGEMLYINNNPTNADIDTLNNLKGYEPIYDTRMRMLALTDLNQDDIKLF